MRGISSSAMGLGILWGAYRASGRGNRMKCQKCSKPAIVHLTEVVNDGGAKRAVEIHLCLGHASEAGLIAAGAELVPPPPQMSFSTPPSHKKSDPSKGADTGLPTAIVPT